MSGAEPPAGASLDQLRAAATDCHGCELWEPATQTVFGRGPADARMVLVGDQPGDVEDQRGAPFVGPAGRLLVGALEEAGIDKTSVYVTNAVKHFRFEQRGSRRIHQTPDVSHTTACLPWLQAELGAIRPSLVVLLGATAAKTLLGKDFRVTRQRGQLLDGPSGSGARLIATVHPSSILRTPDPERPAAHAAFVADLVAARTALLA
jgi:uracil-DNA glycosylase family protein